LALVVATASCSAKDDPQETCTEGGKTYRPGDHWRCSDGCNNCDCNAGGVLAMTGRLCTDAATDGRAD
jgi:hypothetical protein